jgi:hypothetical protein
MIKLDEDERIIAVVPEVCCGPGWANTLIWVYIEQSSTHKLRTESIQPEEQTNEMKLLFEPAAYMAKTLKNLVNQGT